MIIRESVYQDVAYTPLCSFSQLSTRIFIFLFIFLPIFFLNASNCDDWTEWV